MKQLFYFEKTQTFFFNTDYISAQRCIPFLYYILFYIIFFLISFMPESYMPESYMPESYMPESYMPESYMPESYMPESYMPESYMPESYMPESYMPESYMHVLPLLSLRSPMSVSQGTYPVFQDDSFIIVGAEGDFVDLFSVEFMTMGSDNVHCSELFIFSF